MKGLASLIFISLLSSFASAASDEVTWDSLGSQWRQNLCVQEAVVPLSEERAEKQVDALKKQILKSHEVSAVKAISYGQTQPEPGVVEELIDLLVLSAVKLERSKSTKKDFSAFRQLAKDSFEVCSRVLVKYPEVKCHGFLMVQIRPEQFAELASEHFTRYSGSNIYLLDMRNQCQQDKVDESCLALAEDYFKKNYLEMCKRGEFRSVDELSSMYKRY